MNFSTITPDQSIALFVKSILVFEKDASHHKTVLPFFADGYPGLMFQQTENGLFVRPHNKQMPLLFLYGQTIKPIELEIEGPYKLIIFQLYPFVLKSFFNVAAKDINDECYDLQQIEICKNRIQKITEETNPDNRIKIITSLLLDVFDAKKETLDLTIRKAILLIINRKGKVLIKQLCQELNLTERTFERRFLKEVGISAKQFSQINQFQQSLEQLTLQENSKQTDIVYANGYADQSHFIRVFKAYTGKTPKKFTRK